MPLTYILAAGIVTVAAVVDVRKRRIPNWLTLSALLSGLAVNVWQSGLDGLALATAGAALGLAALLPFYALKGIGAGDVKLMAGMGALLGAQVLVGVLIYAALVGGLISVLVLLSRGRLLLAVGELFVARVLPSRSGLTAPYGVAIASGVYLAYVLPAVLP